MMIKKEDYVAKIANAAPLQLTIITYELLLGHIDGAKKNPEDLPLYKSNVQKAQEFLKLLLETLDLQYEVSKELFRIYTYVNKLLITAFFSKNMEGLAEAHELLSTLLEGWREIEKNGFAGAPMMENVQQVYAGLTYRNGELSEMVMEDPERGYRA